MTLCCSLKGELLTDFFPLTPAAAVTCMDGWMDGWLNRHVFPSVRQGDGALSPSPPVDVTHSLVNDVRAVGSLQQSQNMH